MGPAPEFRLILDLRCSTCTLRSIYSNDFHTLMTKLMPVCSQTNLFCFKHIFTTWLGLPTVMGFFAQEVFWTDQSKWNTGPWTLTKLLCITVYWVIAEHYQPQFVCLREISLTKCLTNVMLCLISRGETVHHIYHDTVIKIRIVIQKNWWRYISFLYIIFYFTEVPVKKSKYIPK